MADTQRLIREAAAKHGRKKKVPMNPAKPALFACGVAVLTGVLLMRGSPKGLKDALVNDQSVIDVINRDGTGWTAKANPMFDGWTGKDVLKIGANSFEMEEGQDWHYCSPELSKMEGELPESFDPREKWPDCFTEHIYKQGNCSGSWAIAPASALANRYCIQDPEEYKQLALSPQSLISCNYEQKGCDGGSFANVWKYMQTEGVVSETCFPFQGHGVSCEDKCDEETPKMIVQKCITDTIEGTKQELVANGPVVVPIRLVDEIMVYSGGIFQVTPTAKFYKDKTSDKDGRSGFINKMHVVKLLGWGVEGDLEYWIIENSWGPEWGENGYAKMVHVPMESQDGSSEQDQKNVLMINMPIVAYPANMKQPGAAGGGGGGGGEFDDTGDDELTFDDADGLDEEIFTDDAFGDDAFTDEAFGDA